MRLLASAFPVLAVGCIVQSQPPARSGGELPANEYGGQASDDSGVGHLDFSCAFSDAWVAVLPVDFVTDSEREFAMQALIGLTEDPSFWANETDYARFKPYAARRCADRQSIELAAGEYEVWVGWAGQFQRTNYTRNGHISRVTIAGGKRIEKTFQPQDMTLDFTCISCPFVSVRTGGAMVELGQILVDRYSERHTGTDSKTVAAEVVDGKVRVELSEREDEVSYIDAVRVFAGGTELAPDPAVPSALHAIDGAHHTMSIGQSIALDFVAPVDSGSLTVTIQVSGYYRLNRVR